MKISELRMRENYDRVCDETIASFMGRGTGRQWYEHPFFSVYVCDGFCRIGREFLVSMYRHSAVKDGLRLSSCEGMCAKLTQAVGIGKRWGQRLLVDAMGGILFDAMLTPAFELEPKCHDDSMMIMPGNRRFRLFDFMKGTVATWAKVGFDSDGIVREVKCRERLAKFNDWIIPVCSFDGKVIEEKLIKGISIDRIEDETTRNKAETRVWEIIGELRQVDRRSMSSAEYLDRMNERFTLAKERVHQRFPGVSFVNVDRMWASAAMRVSKIDAVELSLSHGDLQPGNVLVSECGHVSLIDWEDAGLRASVYDCLTYCLKSRRPGVEDRVMQFVNNNSMDTLGNALEDVLGVDRSTAVALWRLEEWIWLLETSSQEGITRLPLGLCRQFRELAYSCHKM